MCFKEHYLVIVQSTSAGFCRNLTKETRPPPLFEFFFAAHRPYVEHPGLEISTKNTRICFPFQPFFRHFQTKKNSRLARLEPRLCVFVNTCSIKRMRASCRHQDPRIYGRTPESRYCQTEQRIHRFYKQLQLFRAMAWKIHFPAG